MSNSDNGMKGRKIKRYTRENSSDKHKQVVINLSAAITAFIVFELGNVTFNETRNNALINDLFDKLENKWNKRY